jgi:hypothetical protein
LESELWTEKEIKLLKEFGEVFFKKSLLIYPIPNDLLSITEILIMMWNAKFDMKKLLLIWKKIGSIESLLHFNDLIFQDSKFKSGFKINNGFASEELSKVICHWLASTSVRDMFSDNIEFFILGDSAVDEEILDELSVSYEIIKANPWKGIC